MSQPQRAQQGIAKWNDLFQRAGELGYKAIDLGSDEFLKKKGNKFEASGVTVYIQGAVVKWLKSSGDQLIVLDVMSDSGVRLVESIFENDDYDPKVIVKLATFNPNASHGHITNQADRIQSIVSQAAVRSLFDQVNTLGDVHRELERQKEEMEEQYLSQIIDLKKTMMDGGIDYDELEANIEENIRKEVTAEITQEGKRRLGELKEILQQRHQEILDVAIKKMAEDSKKALDTAKEETANATRIADEYKAQLDETKKDLMKMTDELITESEKAKICQNQAATWLKKYLSLELITVKNQGDMELLIAKNKSLEEKLQSQGSVAELLIAKNKSLEEKLQSQGSVASALGVAGIGSLLNRANVSSLETDGTKSKLNFQPPQAPMFHNDNDENALPSGMTPGRRNYSGTRTPKHHRKTHSWSSPGDSDFLNRNPDPDHNPDSRSWDHQENYHHQQQGRPPRSRDQEGHSSQQRSQRSRSQRSRSQRSQRSRSQRSQPSRSQQQPQTGGQGYSHSSGYTSPPISVDVRRGHEDLQDDLSHQSDVSGHWHEDGGLDGNRHRRDGNRHGLNGNRLFEAQSNAPPRNAPHRSPEESIDGPPLQDY